MSYDYSKHRCGSRGSCSKNRKKVNSVEKYFIYCYREERREKGRNSGVLAWPAPSAVLQPEVEQVWSADTAQATELQQSGLNNFFSALLKYN